MKLERSCSKRLSIFTGSLARGSWRRFTEHREEDREHTDLRGGGDAERVADDPRTGDPRAERGPSQRIPAAAPDDSRNPTECTRNGSATSRPNAANARSRLAGTGRPRNVAAIAMPAIAEARNTDGSQRVIVPNSTRTASPSDEPAAEPEPARAAAGDREDERHVRATDGEQVAEPRVAEVVDQIVGQCAVSPRRKPASRARSVAGRRCRHAGPPLAPVREPAER